MAANGAVFGVNWHTIYVKLNLWAKSGVLENIYKQMQKKGMISIKKTHI
jgi:hypothetical protein